MQDQSVVHVRLGINTEGRRVRGQCAAASKCLGEEEVMRDKDVQSPSRSCDEPGGRRFCWLGNLQGAGAFAAKQACCSRESSNVSGAPDSGTD